MTPEQKKHWHNAKRETKSIKDKLGKPIDKGILDTVVILRLMGFKTYMSCEGHLDRGGGPMVSFDAPDADTNRAELVKLRKEPQSDQRDQKIREINIKMARGRLFERQKLFPYLDEFYRGRNTPYIYRLALETIGYMPTALGCQGDGLASSLSPEPIEVRKKILARQQKEMRDFTQFLKPCFYDDQSQNIAKNK